MLDLERAQRPLRQLDSFKRCVTIQSHSGPLKVSAQSCRIEPIDMPDANASTGLSRTVSFFAAWVVCQPFKDVCRTFAVRWRLIWQFGLDRRERRKERRGWVKVTTATHPSLVLVREKPSNRHVWCNSDRRSHWQSSRDRGGTDAGGNCLLPGTTGPIDLKPFACSHS